MVVRRGRLLFVAQFRAAAVAVNKRKVRRCSSPSSTSKQHTPMEHSDRQIETDTDKRRRAKQNARTNPELEQPSEGTSRRAIATGSMGSQHQADDS